MTNVSNKTLELSSQLLHQALHMFQSCGLLRKMVMGYGLLVSFAPLPLPYDDHKMEPKRHVSHKTSIYLRAPLNTGTLRVFCALVPSLVDEHGS